MAMTHAFRSPARITGADCLLMRAAPCRPRLRTARDSVPSRDHRERSRLVNRCAARHRADDLQVLDLLLVHREKIVRQYHEVR